MSDERRDPPAPPPDPDELARFLRPQPPPVVTPRLSGPYLPGLWARELLGDRVIKS